MRLNLRDPLLITVFDHALEFEPLRLTCIKSVLLRPFARRTPASITSGPWVEFRGLWYQAVSKCPSEMLSAAATVCSGLARPCAIGLALLVRFLRPKLIHASAAACHSIGPTRTLVRRPALLPFSGAFFEAHEHWESRRSARDSDYGSKPSKRSRSLPRRPSANSNRRKKGHLPDSSFFGPCPSMVGVRERCLQCRALEQAQRIARLGNRSRHI